MDRASVNRIEKRIILRAPRSQVRQALAEVDEFGQWFGGKVECGFDNSPPEYRDLAYPGNEGGWSQQMLSIESYLAEVA